MILSRFLAVITVVAGLASAGTARANLCNDLIRSNQFVTERGFADYVIYLGEGLRKDVEALSSGDLVIDYGAGDGVAASQIAAENGKPKVTAIAYQKGGNYSIPGFRYLTGRYFADIPLAEILSGAPGARVGIDHWGILAYTSTLSEDLDKIARAQLPGSRLYVRTNSATATERFAILAAARKGEFHPFRPQHSGMSGRFKGYGSTLDTTVVQDGERFLMLSEWLAALPQFKVTRGDSVLILERTADTSPVPPLKFIKARQGLGKPYPRLFQTTRQ